MEEIPDFEKHAIARREFWAFSLATLRNWHTWITYASGLGILCVLDKEGVVIPPWIIPWFVVSGVIVGAFYTWRSERREKEKLQKERPARTPTQGNLGPARGIKTVFVHADSSSLFRSSILSSKQVECKKCSAVFIAERSAFNLAGAMFGSIETVTCPECGMVQKYPKDF
jgi:hypothetical protein